MKRILLSCLSLFVFFTSHAQVNFTANDIVNPYEGVFRPGTNLGFQDDSALYSDEDLANIAAGNPAEGIIGAGAKAIRPSLPSNFIDTWGLDLRVPTFATYNNLGLEDLTCFVGYPSEDQRDPNSYSGCGSQSTMFDNLYEPIWDGGANGTPYNDENYYAAYLYNVVSTYTDHVKFWEIWNEPGFDLTGNRAWRPPGDPVGNWWDRDPDPCEYILRAPIEHYVRTLRISYEVVKSISPDDYVAIAGVGSESFLDAILRNTDEPTSGMVTPEYPFGGGAYFDVMGFHSYPDIDGTTRYWEPSINNFVYLRHSDGAANGIGVRQDLYRNVLANYGYDGVTYPNKEWIITEMNVPRKQFKADGMGDLQLQINYMAKAVVNAMKNNVRQMHIYSIFEEETEANASEEFHLLGLYKNLDFNAPYDNLEINQQGIAYKSASDALFGTTYDADKTAELNLPASMDGGAFRDAQGEYVYCLWAKTTIDRSEDASATYSFPASFNLNSVYQRNWNFAYSGEQEEISSNNISFNATPVFLTEDEADTTPLTPFFTASETEGCDPMTVTFTDNTVPTASSWLWTFEGGTPATSTLANPVVTYDVAGVYGVKLEVASGDRSGELERLNYITVNASAKSLFTIQQLNSNTVALNNQSTNAQFYSWSFGDGTSSNDRSPFHTYAEPGLYTICLAATGDCGSDNSCQQVVIDDLNPTGGSVPNADFSADVLEGCGPLTVQFTDLSTNNPSTWNWTFEGGTPATSSMQNPLVTFEDAGEFTVLLTAGNIDGNDQETKLNMIDVEAAPTPNFVIEVDGANVVITNTSADILNNSYDWSFGDDSTSSLVSPSHTYTEEGQYVITLTATNDCGSITYSEAVNIIIDSASSAPSASFSASTQNGCGPLTVEFTDASSNDPTSWNWTFEGGTPATSTEQNPTVVFNDAGDYSVILEASNGNGANMDIQLSYISVIAEPDVNFDTGSNGLEVNFNNKTLYGDTFTWDFGDGSTSTMTNPSHVYAENGTYTVTLTAENECGSVSETRAMVVSELLAPQVDFSSTANEGCAPLTITFTDLSTNNPGNWLWSFDGGDITTSSEQNPTVTFADPGSYTVILQAGNDIGSNSRVLAAYVKVFDAPVADFVSSTFSETVTFVNSSTGATEYLWDFGDGNTSTEENPNYTYATNGTYIVTLTATNPCSSSTITAEVEIDGLAAPSASFSSDISSGCAPMEVTYTDESLNNPTSWTWLFEGGTPSMSNEQNPIVTYNEAGVYSVTLSVSNAVGNNVVNMAEVIVVAAAPTASFDINGTEGFIVFTNTSERADSYSWDFGDGNTSTEENPIHDYAEPGSYTVTLTTTNECGELTETTVIEVESVNAIEDLTSISSFDLYPNPSTGIFTLSLEGDSKEYIQVSILNVLGQELELQRLDFGSGFIKQEFDMSHLSEGVYLVRLQVDNQAEYHKIIIAE
jgi:PKD repeat protein